MHARLIHTPVNVSRRQAKFSRERATNDAKWERAGSSARRHVAKQNAALALGGLRRLDKLYGHRFGRRAEILDDRIRDVFDERALGLNRAAFQKIDHDFRHHFLRVSYRHLRDIKCAVLPVRTCLK